MLTISIYSTVKIFLFEHIFIVCKQRAKADSTALHCLLDGVSGTFLIPAFTDIYFNYSFGGLLTKPRLYDFIDL